MADTSSPLLGLLLMGTGGDNNAWGSNLNTQVITLIENAIAGVTTLSVAGGSHSLSAAEARSATIILIGALTSDQTIVVPGTTKKWTFVNNTTGAFFVIVKAGSGSGCNVPFGTSKDITCVDANTVIRKDRDQVGRLFYHGDSTPPSGTLECNGATALRASVIDLFNEIGTTWGVGDGFTTFTLPNGEDTNRYLRAASGSLTVGTYQSNTTGPHTHPAATFSGTTGTESNTHTHVAAGTTGFENQSHTHNYNAPQPGGASGTGGGIEGAPPANTATGAENQNHTHSFSVTTGTPSTTHTHNISGTTGTIPANTGTETRPESLVGLLCINY